MTFGQIDTARSFLFVPGDRPDRFNKAMASGADAVVLDLEDAVAPTRKPQALENVLRHLAADVPTSTSTPVVVRINAVGSAWSHAELQTLGTLQRPLVVMVPKAEQAHELADVVEALPAGSGTIALVETAAGVLDARSVARAEGVLRLAFGHLDLCAQLGLDPDDDARLAPARFALVAASAAESLPPPIDGVSTAVKDFERIRNAAQAAYEAGFTGKLCIHPLQVAPVHAAFAPTEDELTWAAAVLDESGSRGMANANGEFVDRPVILRAESILSRARNVRD